MIRASLNVALLFAAVLGSTANAFDIGFDPAAEPAKAASAYFVPENQLVFKLVFPNGEVQEFERDYDRGGQLQGPPGWNAAFCNGGLISVESDLPPHGQVRFEFLKGRLVALTCKGKRTEFPYEEKRKAPEGVVPPLQVTPEMDQEAARAYAEREFRHKWLGTGRLAFPYVNPNQNGALYAELAVLFLGLLMMLTRRPLRLLFGTLLVLAAGCLVWTMSRGAWLGFGLASCGFVAIWGRGVLRSRRFWIVAGCVSLVLVLFIALNGYGGITRGFSGASSWSNAIRVEIMKLAPFMMVDAPGGWDFAQVGNAYLQWYQPLNVFALTPTLINDHLTTLVRFGWTGRFVYLFLAALVGISSLTVLVRRSNPMPFAMWSVLAVSAFFNPVSHRPEMWILPLAASLISLRDLPLRRPLFTGSLLTASALVSALGLWGFAACGSKPRPTSIRAEGNRVLVNGPKPSIWVVDNGDLGGGLTGKDIREFYSVVPRAPALGYVKGVEELPDRGVEKLVLFGSAGSDWLTLLSEKPEARERLPKQVLFLSPSFSPSTLPEGVLAMCRPRVLVGEFAALYDPEYEKSWQFVQLVPGMERYLLRWMSYVMEF